MSRVTTSLFIFDSAILFFLTNNLFTELTNARIRCVDCVKKDRKDRNNKWIANLSQQSTEKSEEQKLKIKQAKKKYNQSEKGKLYIKKRNQSEYYKELQRKCGKQYRQTERGKQKKREYQRKWMEIPENRIASNIGGVLNETLKGEHISQHTIKYTGLNSGEELMTYLETLFTKDMTRDNYGIPKNGSPGWAIDHIIPRKLYDHSDEKEIFKCWNWRNLQPMWMKENSTKGCKLTPQMFNVPVEYWPKCLVDSKE